MDLLPRSSFQHQKIWLAHSPNIEIMVISTDIRPVLWTSLEPINALSAFSWIATSNNHPISIHFHSQMIWHAQAKLHALNSLCRIFLLLMSSSVYWFSLFICDKLVSMIDTSAWWNILKQNQFGSIHVSSHNLVKSIIRKW